MTFDEIDRLARANGIVITDWQNLDTLRVYFPDIPDTSIEPLLDQIHTSLGDYADAAINGSEITHFLTNLAAHNEIDLGLPDEDEPDFYDRMTADQQRSYDDAAAFNDRLDNLRREQ